jgi:transcriptional regulator with XRE-family HTH domain
MKPEHVQVAATLRRMRETSRVTRDEAAAVLGCTKSKIGDLETGRSKPKPAELERLLDHYGIMGAKRDEMIEFARSSRTRRKPSPYPSVAIPATVRRAVDLEAQAISTVYFSPELIPGLLQTREYARALFEGAWKNQPEDIAKRLELRMERAAVLTREPRPLRCQCILGEAALLANIGGPKVMQEQIARLITLNSTLNNLTIQILPLGSGPHAFIGITVTIHRFPPPAQDMMLLEGFWREMIRDGSNEIDQARDHLARIRAKSLNPQQSTEFMRRVRDGLNQRQTSHLTG